MLNLFPRRLPWLCVTRTVVHLLLGAMSVELVADHAISTLMLHIALRGDFVELSGLCQVVAFDVLGMEIMLHNVAIPVAILALGLHCLQVLDHVWIMDIVRDGIVKLRVPPFVAGWNLILGSQLHLDLPRIVAMLGILFVPRIVELLGDRIKLPRGRELVRSLQTGQLPFFSNSNLVVLRVAIVDNVEIADSAGVDLALVAGSFYVSGARLRLVPMVIVERQI